MAVVSYALYRMPIRWCLNRGYSSGCHSVAHGLSSSLACLATTETVSADRSVSNTDEDADVELAAATGNRLVQLVSSPSSDDRTAEEITF